MKRRNPYSGFRGEWWITDDGTSVYADQDTGDYGHEYLALEAIFGSYTPPGFDEDAEDDPDEDAEDDPDEDGSYPEKPKVWSDDGVYEHHWSAKLDEVDQATLRKQGAPETLIEFFSRRNADPRLYAVQYMDWIRVKDNTFACWKWTDNVLKRIQNFDGWDEFDEPEDDAETYITAEAPGDDMDDMVPLKALFKAESAAGLKAYVRGIGMWHRSNPARKCR